jgi:membrane-associated phospholipid phosphatase
MGFYAPLLIVFLNVAFLFRRGLYLWVYLIFFFINTWINKGLKTIIREPRPNGYDTNLENPDLKYRGVEVYGMPSGHSQSIFYSVAYLWFVLESVPLLLFGLFVCAITLYQRWKQNRHTLSQLIGGAICGILVAYGSTYLVRKRILV